VALDTRDPFSSAMQAHTELAKVFDDGDAVATSEALENIVLQVRTARWISERPLVLRVVLAAGRGAGRSPSNARRSG
jgi:hypothetical protein